MRSKVVFFSQGESGSISILVVFMIMAAISLCYGIVAVAETLIQKKEAMYGTQSTINSAAFIYGQTIIKKTRECVKEDIEELDATFGLDPGCDRDQLAICLESDFVTCDVDLSSCVPDQEELVQSCMNDDKVISESMDAAQNSAHQVAEKYKLENLQLSLSDEIFKIKARKVLDSQLPLFGSKGKLYTQAESSFSIAKKEE